MDPIYKRIRFKIQETPESKPTIYECIDGKCTWFREDGSICEVANFLMGMLHGENVVFNADGTIKQYSFYELGRKVS